MGSRAVLDTEGRGKVLSPLPGIESQSPGRPARSQTLYRLIYPAYRHVMLLTVNMMWNFRFSWRWVWRWIFFCVVAMYSLVEIETFERSLLSPSSRWRVAHLPDDGGSKHVWNIGKFLPNYTAQRRSRSHIRMLCESRREENPAV
jgi:hypothetical protein